MGIEKLNSAAWAAGFAMAPTEDDAVESALAGDSTVAAEEETETGWRSATVPAAQSEPGYLNTLRQWLHSWQRKAAA